LSFQGAVTHQVKASECAEMFEHLAKERDEYLGVVVDWRE
jgi:hypothetical protein